MIKIRRRSLQQWPDFHKSYHICLLDTKTSFKQWFVIWQCKENSVSFSLFVPLIFIVCSELNFVKGKKTHTHTFIAHMHTFKRWTMSLTPELFSKSIIDFVDKKYGCINYCSFHLNCFRGLFRFTFLFKSQKLQQK